MAAIQMKDTKTLASRAELFSDWVREGERLGWSTEKAEALFFKAQERMDVQEELAAASSRAVELVWQAGLQSAKMRAANFNRCSTKDIIKRTKHDSGQG